MAAINLLGWLFLWFISSTEMSLKSGKEAFKVGFMDRNLSNNNSAILVFQINFTSVNSILTVFPLSRNFYFRTYVRDNKTEALYRRVIARKRKRWWASFKFYVYAHLSCIASILLRALRLKLWRPWENRRSWFTFTIFVYLIISFSFFLSFIKALSPLAFNYKPTSFISGGKKHKKKTGETFSLKEITGFLKHWIGDIKSSVLAKDLRSSKW